MSSFLIAYAMAWMWMFGFCCGIFKDREDGLLAILRYLVATFFWPVVIIIAMRVKCKRRSD